MTDNSLLEILYFQVTDLWKRLCEKHSELYNLTCDEYSFLLKSDVENLDHSVSLKQELIHEINGLEQIRRDIIRQINQDLNYKIETVSQLLNLMQEFEEKNGRHYLKRFNSFLIEIIEKIQGQNKKNQIFINKALSSLKEIREEATGKKSYPTYTANGATTKSTTELFVRR